jgi:histidinol phosphatase-like PHP family hydrolase
VLDLHCHSLLSDGELLPGELVRRVEVLGYRYLAITDHAGPSNLGWVVEGVLSASSQLNEYLSCKLIPGVELTHVPPKLIAPLAEQARRLGARWVVIHGETVVEPVRPGTNQAALEAEIDLLAHPGLLTFELADLAARRGIALELSARKGHCLTNGLIARLAQKTGASLLIDSDAHSPSDIMSESLAQSVALGAGLSQNEYETIQQKAMDLAARALANEVYC